jgi:hypothetical protein
MAYKRDKYRSGLERDFARLLEDNNIPVVYEQTKLKYKQPEVLRTYLVDFEYKDLIIETKGRLTSPDRRKMLLVQEQHPDKKVVMLFDRKNRKLYKGSNTTYEEWCNKNNLACLEMNDVKGDLKCLLSMTRKPKDLKLSTLHQRKKKP